jgi:hypothetical protein
MFEVPVMTLVEVNDDGQDFTEAHAARLVGLY